MLSQVNTIFLGHYGTEHQQAAVGLAIMMQNCVAINTAFGLLGALDTLVSQSYGAGDYELCCTHLQRGRAITAIQLVWQVRIPEVRWGRKDRGHRQVSVLHHLKKAVPQADSSCNIV